MKNNYINYIEGYEKIIKGTIKANNNQLNLIKNKIKAIKNQKLVFFGNGGSSAISSHIATDISKNINISALTFTDADLITCFANDYKFENYIKKICEKYIKKKDIVVLISSSGQSKNMLNAAKYLKKNKIFLITFTGFKKNNPLSKIGNINIWINSKSYNYVEMAHLQLLMMIIDSINEEKL